MTTSNMFCQVVNCEFTDLVPAGTSSGLIGTGVYSVGTGSYGTIVKVGGVTNNERNKFTNCQYGIVADGNRNVSILNNIINSSRNMAIEVKNCRVANSSYSIAVNNNNISDYKTGIHWVDNYSTTTINNNNLNFNVTGTTNNPNTYGIRIENAVLNANGAHVDALNNTVRFANTGVFMQNVANVNANANVIRTSNSANATYTNGILLSNTKNCEVKENNVTGSGQNNYWVNGIRLESCVNTAVTCNNSNSIGSGLFFTGNSPSTVMGNAVQNCYWGLVLNNNGYIGTQGNSPATGGSDNPSDNSWMGSFVGSKTLCYYSDGRISDLFERNVPNKYNSSGSNLNSPGSNLSFSFDYLTNTNISTIYTSTQVLDFCGNPIVPYPNGNNGGGGLRQLARNIAKNEQPVLSNVNSQSVLNNQFVLSAVKEDANMLQDADILSAYNNLSGTNTEKIYDTRQYISSNQLSLANLLNNNISYTNSYEENSRTVASFYINKIAIDSSLTASELDELKRIASLCPYIEGMAVYEARSILSLYDTLQYVNACEIIEPQMFSSRLKGETTSNLTVSSTQNDLNQELNFKNKSRFYVNIHPNPAKDKLNIQIENLSNSKPIKFQIIDVNGSIILEKILLENSFEVGLRDIESGAYYCRIVNDEAILESKKLIIIK